MTARWCDPSEMHSVNNIDFSPGQGDPSMMISRLEALFCVVLAVVVAFMVASSRLSAIPNADSILFSIISLQKLTPYYWAQNRVGSLLPFLASPLHNIEWNLFAQIWLRAFSAAMTPLFLVYIIRPRIPALLAFSAALAAVFLLMKKDALVPYWLDGSPYATSLLIFTIGAFALREKWAPLFVRFPVALLFAFVSSWTNIGVVIVLAPVLAILAIVKKSWVYAGLLAIALIAYVAERFHSHAYDSTSYDGLSYAPDIQWAGLLSAVYRAINIVPLAILAVAVLILVWVWKKEQRTSLTAVLLACAATIALTSVTTWFKINEFHPRYISLPMTLIVSAVGIGAVQLAYDFSRRARVVLVPAMAVLAIGACAIQVRPRMIPIWIDRDTEALASVAIDRDIHLVAGDYWRVWPAVFEMISRRRTLDSFGMAPRGHLMVLELREKLAADKRFICVDDPVNCLNLMTYYTGSDKYQGKSLSESMIPTDISYEPYFIVYELR